MKFLFISTLKDTASMVPPGMQRQLLEATVAYMDELKKKGKLLEAYHSPDGAAIAICEHPSAEDAVQTVASIPMYGLLDIKAYPLADFNKSMQAFIEACKKGEKLFPSAAK